MTIAQHLLAIAEELERADPGEQVWVATLFNGLINAKHPSDEIAAFRRAASLAQEQEP